MVSVWTEVIPIDAILAIIPFIAAGYVSIVFWPVILAKLITWTMNLISHKYHVRIGWVRLSILSSHLHIQDFVVASKTSQYKIKDIVIKVKWSGKLVNKPLQSLKQSLDESYQIYYRLQITFTGITVFMFNSTTGQEVVSKKNSKKKSKTQQSEEEVPQLVEEEINKLIAESNFTPAPWLKIFSGVALSMTNINIVTGGSKNPSFLLTTADRLSACLRPTAPSTFADNFAYTAAFSVESPSIFLVSNDSVSRMKIPKNYSFFPRRMVKNFFATAGTRIAETEDDDLKVMSYLNNDDDIYIDLLQSIPIPLFNSVSMEGTLFMDHYDVKWRVVPSLELCPSLSVSLRVPNAKLYFSPESLVHINLIQSVLYPETYEDRKHVLFNDKSRKLGHIKFSLKLFDGFQLVLANRNTDLPISELDDTFRYLELLYQRRVIISNILTEKDGFSEDDLPPELRNIDNMFPEHPCVPGDTGISDLTTNIEARNYRREHTILRGESAVAQLVIPLQIKQESEFITKVDFTVNSAKVLSPLFPGKDLINAKRMTLLWERHNRIKYNDVHETVWQLLMSDSSVLLRRDFIDSLMHLFADFGAPHPLQFTGNTQANFSANGAFQPNNIYFKSKLYDVVFELPIRKMNVHDPELPILKVKFPQFFVDSEFPRTEFMPSHFGGEVNVSTPGAQFSVYTPKKYPLYTLIGDTNADIGYINFMSVNSKWSFPSFHHFSFHEFVSSDIRISEAVFPAEGYLLEIFNTAMDNFLFDCRYIIPEVVFENLNYNNVAEEYFNRKHRFLDHSKMNDSLSYLHLFISTFTLKAPGDIALLISDFDMSSTTRENTSTFAASSYSVDLYGPDTYVPAGPLSWNGTTIFSNNPNRIPIAGKDKISLYPKRGTVSVNDGMFLIQLGIRFIQSYDDAVLCLFGQVPHPKPSNSLTSNLVKKLIPQVSSFIFEFDIGDVEADVPELGAVFRMKNIVLINEKFARNDHVALIRALTDISFERPDASISFGAEFRKTYEVNDFKEWKRFLNKWTQLCDAKKLINLKSNDYSFKPPTPRRPDAFYAVSVPKAELFSTFHRSTDIDLYDGAPVLDLVHLWPKNTRLSTVSERALITNPTVKGNVIHFLPLLHLARFKKYRFKKITIIPATKMSIVIPKISWEYEQLSAEIDAIQVCTLDALDKAIIRSVSVNVADFGHLSIENIDFTKLGPSQIDIGCVSLTGRLKEIIECVRDYLPNNKLPDMPPQSPQLNKTTEEVSKTIVNFKSINIDLDSIMTIITDFSAIYEDKITLIGDNVDVRIKEPVFELVSYLMQLNNSSPNELSSVKIDNGTIFGVDLQASINNIGVSYSTMDLEEASIHVAVNNLLLATKGLHIPCVQLRIRDGGDIVVTMKDLYYLNELVRIKSLDLDALPNPMKLIFLRHLKSKQHLFIGKPSSKPKKQSNGISKVLYLDRVYLKYSTTKFYFEDPVFVQLSSNNFLLSSPNSYLSVPDLDKPAIFPRIACCKVENNLFANISVVPTIVTDEVISAIISWIIWAIPLSSYVSLFKGSKQIESPILTPIAAPKLSISALIEGIQIRYVSGCNETLVLAADFIFFSFADKEVYSLGKSVRTAFFDSTQLTHNPKHFYFSDTKDIILADGVECVCAAQCNFRLITISSEKLMLNFTNSEGWLVPSALSAFSKLRKHCDMFVDAFSSVKLPQLDTENEILQKSGRLLLIGFTYSMNFKAAGHVADAKIELNSHIARNNHTIVFKTVVKHISLSFLNFNSEITLSQQDQITICTNAEKTHVVVDLPEIIAKLDVKAIVPFFFFITSWVVDDLKTLETKPRQKPLISRQSDLTLFIGKIDVTVFHDSPVKLKIPSISLEMRSTAIDAEALLKVSSISWTVPWPTVIKVVEELRSTAVVTVPKSPLMKKSSSVIPLRFTLETQEIVIRLLQASPAAMLHKIPSVTALTVSISPTLFYGDLSKSLIHGNIKRATVFIGHPSYKEEALAASVANFTLFNNKNDKLIDVFTGAEHLSFKVSFTHPEQLSCWSLPSKNEVSCKPLKLPPIRLIANVSSHHLRINLSDQIGALKVTSDYPIKLCLSSSVFTALFPPIQGIFPGHLNGNLDISGVTRIYGNPQSYWFDLLDLNSNLVFRNFKMLSASIKNFTYSYDGKRHIKADNISLSLGLNPFVAVYRLLISYVDVFKMRQNNTKLVDSSDSFDSDIILPLSVTYSRMLTSATDKESEEADTLVPKCYRAPIPLDIDIGSFFFSAMNSDSQAVLVKLSHFSTTINSKDLMISFVHFSLSVSMNYALGSLSGTNVVSIPRSAMIIDQLSSTWNIKSNFSGPVVVATFVPHYQLLTKILQDFSAAFELSNSSDEKRTETKNIGLFIFKPKIQAIGDVTPSLETLLKWVGLDENILAQNFASIGEALMNSIK